MAALRQIVTKLSDFVLMQAAPASDAAQGSYAQDSFSVDQTSTGGPPGPHWPHRQKPLSLLKELLFSLLDSVGGHIELLGQFHQRLLASDDRERH